MIRARLLAVAAAAALAAAPASACRLALALALDVSSSVDSREYALQAEGVASALEHPRVQEAILSGEPVAVAIFEWSGERQQTLVADWTLLSDAVAVAARANRVRTAGRSSSTQPTAIGSALAFAARLLAEGPPCGRRTVDVSGDGANNTGIEPFQTYAALDFAGVTVNALVIGGTRRPALIRYFQTLGIHGPDAFTEVAEDYEDYGRAMTRKLLRELQPQMILGSAR